MYHLMIGAQQRFARIKAWVGRAYWATFWFVVRSKPRPGEPGHGG